MHHSTFIGHIASIYNPTTYVELGLYHGETITKVQPFAKKLYGIDIKPNEHLESLKRFSNIDNNVELLVFLTKTCPHCVKYDNIHMNLEKQLKDNWFNTNDTFSINTKDAFSLIEKWVDEKNLINYKDFNKQFQFAGFDKEEVSVSYENALTR